MLSVFTDVVLAVFVIAVLGHVVGRWRGIEVASLTASTFYLFSPALVFHSLSRTELSWTFGSRLLVVVGTGWLTVAVLAYAWTRFRGHDSAKRAAVLLSAVTANGGNMGIPVSALAFGDAGLEIAVVNFVVGAVISNSAGIAIASSGKAGSRREILTAPFRFPYLYAAAAGLLVNATDADLPVVVEAPVESLAGAAIPVMLVVLGLQLRNPATRTDAADVGFVTSLRLLVAPAIAWPVATMVGLDGVERATLTILAAMPVAVITTIVATEFQIRPDFVTRAVIISTAASIVTLTPLISMVT